LTNLLFYDSTNKQKQREEPSCKEERNSQWKFEQMKTQMQNN